MAEKPDVVISVYSKPDGGVAVVSTPSMAEMMKLEGQGKLLPSHGAAIFALTMLYASERHAKLVGGKRQSPIWTPRKPS